MKRLITGISAFLCLMIPAAPSQLQGRMEKRITADGAYVGRQPMNSLSPEDPSRRWLHENTLLIENGEAILDMVPITIRRGVKRYSTSDGGFFTYRGRFFVNDGRSFVAMRLFASDYAAVAVPKVGSSPYSEIKTYPVRAANTAVEINGVTYRRTTLDRKKREFLLEQLRTHSLEFDSQRRAR